MKTNPAEAGPVAGPIDFGIVTALKVEREAVLRRLDCVTPVQEDEEPLTFYLGEIAIPGTDQRYRVVVVQLLGMGNDEAAIGTTRLIQRWAPADVVMVGIAGGVRGKVALGDVVVAEYCYYYELAKRTTRGEQRRPQQFPADRLLYGRAQAYEATDWKADVAVARPGAAQEVPPPPEAHFGPVASGEKVIADRKTLPPLLAECPKLLAVAMEGAGVARAASSHGSRPRFLEVRGICDFADEHKNDDWHRFAADAAAAFTIGFLRTRPVPPLPAPSAVAENRVPLILLRAQSLRQIRPDELLGALDDGLRMREHQTVALDFTDLFRGGLLAEPETATSRLTDRQGILQGVLGRQGDAELAFHGLVHIPLAVLAGHLVSDRQPVRLFDFHPSPGSDTWSWPETDGDYPTLSVSQRPSAANPSPGEAVVRISVSYPVSATQTEAVVRDPVLAVDLSVASPTRSNVRSEAQVRAYGRVFRQVLDDIAGMHPEVTRIHIFYAGPVALAFHLGQQISENIHPPVTVWNFRRGYDWGIDFAAAYLGEPAFVRPPLDQQAVADDEGGHRG